MNTRSVTAVLLFASLLAAFSPAAVAVTAGSFEFVMGDVRVRGADGRERAVRRGDPLEVGEIVVTGPLANAQMRMVDNAFIAVRPDSELNITDYRFSGRPEQDNVLLRLAKGTLRAFTGAISASRKDRFQMATPTATVGIRGSGNVLHFSPALGTLNHTIEGSHAVSSVNAAGQSIGTVITNPGQTVQVIANQPPVRVPTPTFLIQAATSRPAPAPQGGGQGGGRSSGSGAGGSSGSGSGSGSASSSGDSGGSGGSGSTAGSTSGSTSGGTGSTGSTDSSTTAGTGSAGGVTATIRVVSATDTALTVPVTSITTTPVVATTTIVPTTTTSTTLTGSTSTGGTLNTSTSTVTTSSGTTTTIAAAAASTTNTVTSGARVLVNYFSYPGTLARPFGNNDQYRTAALSAFDGSSSFTGPNGNFSGFTKTGNNDSNALTIGGDTSGASTVTTLSNGISYGRYASQTVADAFASTGTKLTVSGQDGLSTLTNANVLGNLYWIQGPGTPLVMPRVMTGTATFGGMVASAPIDQNNVAGSPANVTASLSFNFDRQSANTSINVTMGPNGLVGGTQNRVWAASGTDLALSDGGGFRADGGGATSGFGHNNLTITLNGGTATGNVTGQFTGATLNGAILSYIFGGNDPLNNNSTLCGGPCHEHVNGVIGFTTVGYTAAPSTTAPYYVKLSAMGLQGGFKSNDGSTISVGSSSSAANLRERYITPADISIVDANRVKFDANGAVVQYDTNVPVVSTNGSCPSQCNVNETPARVSILGSATAAFTASNGALVPAMPGTSSTPASVTNTGSDSVTGISWGRYTQGAFAVVDRVTGNTLNANADFGPVNHYLLSAQQTGPTSLPLTGSATYTFVGGTSPTDTTGAIGTLNSATLFADFAAKTVTTAVNATVGGRTWTASTPSPVAIIGGMGFEANKSLTATTGNTLSVSCAGSGCQSTVAGRIAGVFTGTTGQGAGIAYSLNTGGAGGITAGGVAAFRK